MDSHGFADLPVLLRSFKDAIPLLWRNRLWKGYFAHGPVSYLSIILVLVISYKTYSYFNPEPVNTIKEEIKKPGYGCCQKSLGANIADSIEKEIQKEGMNAKISLDKDSLEKGVVAMTVNTDTHHQKNEDTLVKKRRSRNSVRYCCICRRCRKEENLTGRKTNIKSHIDEKNIFFRRIQIPFYHSPQHAHSSFCGRIIGMMGGFEKR